MNVVVIAKNLDGNIMSEDLLKLQAECTLQKLTINALIDLLVREGIVDKEELEEQLTLLTKQHTNS